MRAWMGGILAVGLVMLTGCGGGEDDEGEVNTNGETHTNTNSNVNTNTNNNNNTTAVSVLSTFSTTYVPHRSLGGVSLGTTYETVRTAHGQPTSISGFQVYYADGGTGSDSDEIVICFADTDRDNQLSPRDVVDAVIGRGLPFRYNGVGIGSTAAQIIATFGQPYSHAYESSGGTHLQYNDYHYPDFTYTVFRVSESLSTVDSVWVGAGSL